MGGISNYSQIYEPIIKSKRLKVLKKHMKKTIIAEDIDPLSFRKRGMPQGIAWSPVLSTSVLPYSGIYNLPGIAAADDGLYYWNGPSIEDVPRIINDGVKIEGVTVPQGTSNMRRYVGIEFSDKPNSCGYIKKDGRWLTDKLKFLGSTWDLRNMTLNDFPLWELNPETLKKLVGKTYEKKKEKDWDKSKDLLRVDPNSWLTTLRKYRIFVKPENYLKSLYYKMEEGDLVYYCILADKSSICCEQALEVIYTANQDRKKRKTRFLPMDGLELGYHAMKYWSEKEERGRHFQKKRKSQRRTRTKKEEGLLAIVYNVGKKLYALFNKKE